MAPERARRRTHNSEWWGEHLCPKATVWETRLFKCIYVFRTITNSGFKRPICNVHNIRDGKMVAISDIIPDITDICLHRTWFFYVTSEMGLVAYHRRAFTMARLWDLNPGSQYIKKTCKVDSLLSETCVIGPSLMYCLLLQTLSCQWTKTRVILHSCQWSVDNNFIQVSERACSKGQPIEGSIQHTLQKILSAIGHTAQGWGTVLAVLTSHQITKAFQYMTYSTDQILADHYNKVLPFLFLGKNLHIQPSMVSAQ